MFSHKLTGLVVAVTTGFIGGGIIIKNRFLAAAAESPVAKKAHWKAVPPSEHFVINDKDVESEEALWDLYGRWMIYHDVKRDPEEKRERFKMFKEKAIRVHNFNKTGQHKLTLYNFADLTRDEFNRNYLCCDRRDMSKDGEYNKALESLRDSENQMRRVILRAAK